MSRLTVPVIALAAVIASVPAWAQNSNQSPPPQQHSAGNTEIGTATVTPTGIPPSQRNPLLTASGDVRIGKMIGTNIYNKNDKQIGTVDGVVASRSGQLQVIIATNSKKIAVPWDKVTFGDAKLNSDNKVLMPEATQQSLNSLPTYHYQKNGG
jgi:hypothetical protein